MRKTAVGWGGFYPAEDFCYRGAEDMGGQVDENLDLGRVGPYDLGMEHCEKCHGMFLFFFEHGCFKNPSVKAL
uniref:Uncharacterized protein n=1 Tax=Sus scrofa TaxID=9823 RepID=A0A8D0XBF3_PIG